MGIGTILFILFIQIIVFTLVIMSGIKIIEEQQRGVYFLLGKYKHVLKPGWNFVVPLVSEVKVLDIRAQPHDLNHIELISKDGCRFRVSLRVFLKIEEIEKAVLEVEDHVRSSLGIAVQVMREVTGDKTVEQLQHQSHEVVEQLRKDLMIRLYPWGLTVPEVQFLSMEFDRNWQPPQISAHQKDEKKGEGADIPESIFLSRLDHLVDLKQEGHLTDDEFQIAKRKLLAE